MPCKWIPDLLCAKNNTWGSTTWQRFLSQRGNVFFFVSVHARRFEIHSWYWYMNKRSDAAWICVTGYRLSKPNHSMWRHVESQLCRCSHSSCFPLKRVKVQSMYSDICYILHSVVVCLFMQFTLEKPVSLFRVLWGANTLWQQKELNHEVFVY